jgi:glycerate-2-kinase
MLLNLAEVSREAGEYRAALGACVNALALAKDARVRLPGLGCAAIVSARLGEHALVEEFIADIERTILRSGLPFDNARALAEVGEALVTIDGERAIEYASRADSIAERAGFHEISAQTARIAEDVRGRSVSFTGSRPTVRGARWSRSTRAIFARMENMVVRLHPGTVGVEG